MKMLFLKRLFDKLLTLLKGKGGISPRTLELILKDWEDINILLGGQSPSQYKQALIIADKSLDNVLKDLVKGKNMGERLKNSRNLFSKETYSSIWKAHKIRNLIVHESGFDAPSFVVKDAINNIKQGLIELDVKL